MTEGRASRDFDDFDYEFSMRAAFAEYGASRKRDDQGRLNLAPNINAFEVLHSIYQIKATNDLRVETERLRAEAAKSSAVLIWLTVVLVVLTLVLLYFTWIMAARELPGALIVESPTTLLLSLALALIAVALVVRRPR